MCNNNMIELLPAPGEFILGLFGRWKPVGTSQRMLVDARPPNCLLGTPKFVHTGGDSLARMQVAEGHDLEVAKADLKNYYHGCQAPPPLRRFLGCAESKRPTSGRRVSRCRRPKWKLAVIRILD